MCSAYRIILNGHIQEEYRVQKLQNVKLLISKSPTIIFIYGRGLFIFCLCFLSEQTYQQCAYQRCRQNGPTCINRSIDCHRESTEWLIQNVGSENTTLQWNTNDNYKEISLLGNNNLTFYYKDETMFFCQSIVDTCHRKKCVFRMKSNFLGQEKNLSPSVPQVKQTVPYLLPRG